MDTEQQMSQEELTQIELTQEELNQYMQARLEHYLNSDFDDSYEEEDDEDPNPCWNITNWKGNSKCFTDCLNTCNETECFNGQETVVKDKCQYCVTRIDPFNERRGCADCDEYWDMPDLIFPLSDEEESDASASETGASASAGADACTGEMERD